MPDISDDEDTSSVEETNPIEKPKAKKGRKPMSDEQKEAFKERMKKARESKKLDMNSKGYKLAEKKAIEEFDRREEEDERATKAMRERKARDLEIDIKRKKEKEAREEELRNRPPAVVNNYYYGTEKAEPKAEPKAEAKPKKERKPRAKKVKEVKTEPKAEPPKLKEMVFA